MMMNWLVWYDRSTGEHCESSAYGKRRRKQKIRFVTPLYYELLIVALVTINRDPRDDWVRPRTAPAAEARKPEKFTDIKSRFEQSGLLIRPFPVLPSNSTEVKAGEKKVNFAPFEKSSESLKPSGGYSKDFFSTHRSTKSSGHIYSVQAEDLESKVETVQPVGEISEETQILEFSSIEVPTPVVENTILKEEEDTVESDSTQVLKIAINDELDKHEDQETVPATATFEVEPELKVDDGTKVPDVEILNTINESEIESTDEPPVDVKEEVLLLQDEEKSVNIESLEEAVLEEEKEVTIAEVEAVPLENITENDKVESTEDSQLTIKTEESMMSQVDIPLTPEDVVKVLPVVEKVAPKKVSSKTTSGKVIKTTDPKAKVVKKEVKPVDKKPTVKTTVSKAETSAQKAPTSATSKRQSTATGAGTGKTLNTTSIKAKTTTESNKVVAKKPITAKKP